MRTTILTFAALFFLITANAQSNTATSLRVNNRRLTDPASQPLFVINDSIATDEMVKELNPDRIASVDVFKDSSAVAYYGNRARNGVIIIRTKEKPLYINLDELFDQYHIAEADRKLKVSVDNILVKNRNKIMTARPDIIRVEVINEVCWKSPTEAGPEEMHVNIVTRKSLSASY